MQEIHHDHELKDRQEAERVVKDTLKKERADEMREKTQYMQDTRNIVSLWHFISNQINQKKEQK